MSWLGRHSWWGLLFLAVVIALFGVMDMLSGAAADVAIATSLTGLTLAELKADGPAAFRMFDFFTRVNGFSLLLIALLAVLSAAILLLGARPFFRDG